MSHIKVCAITRKNFNDISTYQREAAQNHRFLLCSYKDGAHAHFTLRPPPDARLSQCSFSDIVSLYRACTGERLFEMAGTELRFRNIPANTSERFVADLSAITIRETTGPNPTRRGRSVKAIGVKRAAHSVDEKIYYKVLSHLFASTEYSPIVIENTTLQSISSLLLNNDLMDSYRDATLDMTLHTGENSIIKNLSFLYGIEFASAPSDMNYNDDYWANFHKRYPLSQGLTSLSKIGMDAASKHAVVELRNRIDGGLLSLQNSTASTLALKRFFWLAKDSKGNWTIVEEFKFDEMFWDGEFGPPLTPF